MARSSSESKLERWEPKRDQSKPKEQEEQQEQEEEQQQERTLASLRAPPRNAGDKAHFILQATKDELDRQEEEGEEGSGSSSSSMSSISSSSSLNSLTAFPDEEGEEDEEEEGEVQEEREVAAKALRKEERQKLLQVKELEGGDAEMLSSLLRGIKYIYTLLFDLICMLTEDLFQVCLFALLAFSLSLLCLLKRGAWREVGPQVGQKLQRLSSHLTVIPSDIAHYISNFPFLPSLALMGMGLLLGCGVWYWRLELEYEGTAAAAAAVAAAASTTMERAEERAGDALVELAARIKGVMSG